MNFIFLCMGLLALPFDLAKYWTKNMRCDQNKNNFIYCNFIAVIDKKLLK